MLGVAEVKARGNVLSQVVYRSGTQDAELHFAPLTVPRKSPETPEMMEPHVPGKYDENCEKYFPAQGYAAGEEPGHPRELVCAHPLECENEPVGCQARRYLLVSAPTSDWLIHCHMTIESLAVGENAGGAAMVDDSNPRGRPVSDFLTRIQSVASVVRVVSRLVVDRGPVKRR